MSFDDGGGGDRPQKNRKNKAKKPEKFVYESKPKKTDLEDDEIKRVQEQYESIDPSKLTNFKDLPLSEKTMRGLKAGGFTVPTEIQRESIGLALRGMDILGAAKTGSGKTIAFLIPLLESLFVKKWSKIDGLGGLIITPTRELAYQIFECLRNIGREHDFSAGLIIGGKDLKYERKRLDQVNIIICTPGRLLQHMDENPHFDCSNLQMLILDEADRCLDLGFQKSMNAIIDNLPKERQTLLFSATQTKSVKDLARLSLVSPVYISVHENSKFATPETLQQSYIVCPLESKIDMLWSFLKHHKRSKILVFLSSCKQVRFINLLFCRMRPGISLLALYGSLHQLKRMSVYDEFCRKQAVVLFATDIASRGLDFPAVDWVIQLDCPEDATTYIHRSGRTARFNKNGEALLVLCPSEEEAMITELTKKRIPIEKIEVNQKKLSTVRRKFEALLARDTNLKECAQRAFKAYLKSCFLMKNKNIFDVSQFDLSAYAGSLGLAVAPRVRFLQKKLGNSINKIKSEESDQDSDNDNDEISEHDENDKPNTKINSYSTYDFSVEGEESDTFDDLFIGKREIKMDNENEDEEEIVINTNTKSNKKVKSKASVAKKLMKKKISANKKVVFDEEGEKVSDVHRQRQSSMAREYDEEDTSGINIEKAKEILKAEDTFDKQIFRERIRAKHRQEKLKERKKRKREPDDEVDDFKNENDDEDNYEGGFLVG